MDSKTLFMSAIRGRCRIRCERFENPVLLLQGDKDKIVAKKYSDKLCEYYNSVNKNHCRMIIYGGQPHVFTGKYKVIAARDIYDFIND